MKTCFFLAALLLAGCGGDGGGAPVPMAAGMSATSAAGPTGAPDASFSAVQALLGRDADGEPVPDVALALAEGAEPRLLD